jgi:hypothetical protein
MRKLMMVAVTAAALAIPSSALASASGISQSTGGVGTAQGGKNNQTQQYKALYTDPFFGPVSCTGVHQTGKNTTTLGQDSFTCTSTSGSPLTNVYPGESISLTTISGWISDYYNLLTPPRLCTRPASLARSPVTGCHTRRSRPTRRKQGRHPALGAAPTSRATATPHGLVLTLGCPRSAACIYRPFIEPPSQSATRPPTTRPSPTSRSSRKVSPLLHRLGVRLQPAY